MIYTYVFTKNIGAANFTQPLDLKPGETVTSISQGAVTPASASPPVMAITSGLSPTLAFSLSGGEAGVTYGVPVTVTTNQRVFVATCAFNVLRDTINPHDKNEDPTSYQDLVGALDAGKSALATAMFQFPSDFDPSNGYVVWDILDDIGTVYSSGNAYDYKIMSSGIANIVIAKSVINVPSDVPPSLDNPYQLRYTLKVQDKVAYSYESLTVHGFPDMQVGSVDSIEMQGDIATLSLVTEQMYQNYMLEVWSNNKMIASMAATKPERVSGGYFVGGSVSTNNLPVSLQPYKIIWKFWNVPHQTYREYSSLWIVNPSIINAIEDVKSYVNKARQTLYGTPDSQYPSTEVMKWLRRGMDMFNGSYGIFTGFTMTNALGPLREFWLMYAQKFCLESQFLLEGEKQFDFQGAAISLNVDRTGMLDSMIGKLQGVLDQEVKPFKQNLIIKGNTDGDGSGDGTGDFSKAKRGNLGAVGLSIHPASVYGGGIYGNTRRS